MVVFQGRADAAPGRDAPELGVLVRAYRQVPSVGTHGERPDLGVPRRVDRGPADRIAPNDAAVGLPRQREQLAIAVDELRRHGPRVGGVGLVGDRVRNRGEQRLARLVAVGDPEHAGGAVAARRGQSGTGGIERDGRHGLRMRQLDGGEFARPAIPDPRAFTGHGQVAAVTAKRQRGNRPVMRETLEAPALGERQDQHLPVAGADGQALSVRVPGRGARFGGGLRQCEGFLLLDVPDDAVARSAGRRNISAAGMDRQASEHRAGMLHGPERHVAAAEPGPHAGAVVVFAVGVVRRKPGGIGKPERRFEGLAAFVGRQPGGRLEVHERRGGQGVLPAGLVQRALGLFALVAELLDGPRFVHGEGDRDDHRDEKRQGRHARGRRQEPIAPTPAGQSLDPADRPRTDRRAVQEAAQFVGQFLGGGIASGRLLVEALQGDRLQVAWHARVQLPERDRLLGADLHQGLHRVGGLEGRPAGQEVVEHGSQRVDVRRRADPLELCPRLLRRHVTGRAEDLAGGREMGLVVCLDGQAEVGHARPSLPVQEDVGRLEIPVDHAALMGVMDRGSNGPEANRSARLCPST